MGISSSSFWVASIVVLLVASCSAEPNALVDAGLPGNDVDAGNENDSGTATETDAGAVPVDAGGSDAAPEFAGYALPSDPDPTLPDDGEIDILLVGVPGTQVGVVAGLLQGSLLARPEYDAVRVDSHITSWDGLLNFYFGWTDRDTRLAVLDSGYDYIVFSDVYHAPIIAPEGHFAGALEVANAARALGATPVLMMTEYASPAPDDAGEMCNNTCSFSNGSGCNDGGAASVGTPYCELGTDCNDCGVRTEADRDRIRTEENFWRTAIGTGSLPVPSGAVLGKLQVGQADRPTMMAATLYTAFTGESIQPWVGWPTTGDYPVWADAVLAHHVADQTDAHYLGPRQGSVRIEATTPPTTYNFLTSGTSSEAGYSVAMQALLIREGHTPNYKSVGFCNQLKSVDAECMARVVTEMQNASHISLYARSYSVSRAALHAAIGTTTLQPQSYDRHRDSAQNDGSDSLDDLYRRIIGGQVNSRYYDIAWLPQHINFGKYKVETGSDLLSDGVHATSEVQAGLAAMSYVSRTGLSPSTANVSADTATAIELGEHTIRTLSTFSRTGLHIPDLPQNRVSIP